MIPINLISAISFSSMSSEFVIHVESQYDYWYSSHELWNEVIKSILYSINKTKEFIPFYYIDMINLNTIMTT